MGNQTGRHNEIVVAQPEPDMTLILGGTPKSDSSHQNDLSSPVLYFYFNLKVSLHLSILIKGLELLLGVCVCVCVCAGVVHVNLRRGA